MEPQGGTQPRGHVIPSLPPGTIASCNPSLTLPGFFPSSALLHSHSKRFQPRTVNCEPLPYLPLSPESPPPAQVRLGSLVPLLHIYIQVRVSVRNAKTVCVNSCHTCLSAPSPSRSLDMSWACFHIIRKCPIHFNDRILVHKIHVPKFTYIFLFAVPSSCFFLF